MENNKLVQSIKNGIKDIDDGYTNEAHFLFNKKTLNVILKSLVRGNVDNCSVAHGQTSPVA